MCEKLFSQIAKKYEKANYLLSCGLYPYWNYQLIRAIGKKASLLDLCSGSGYVAFRFLKKNPLSRAHLLDFSAEMLSLAHQRLICFQDRHLCVFANAEKLPFNDNSFEAISCAFGIRNIKEPFHAIQEAFRVLKAGGSFSILELTVPQNRAMAFFHRLYLKTVLPLASKIIFSDTAPYDYLADTILQFDEEKIATLLQKAGFSRIEKRKMSFGIVTLVIATKS